MNTSLILEEYRTRDRLVTLEKGAGIEGARYRVKSVIIKGYANESEARKAFNLLAAKKANSTSDLSKQAGQGVWFYHKTKQTKEKRC